MYVIGIVQRGRSTLKYFSDYYPFGMPMPNRNNINNYRYAYQGQEKDPETGKKAFQLRLWDARIGRWLTTDPKGQFSSHYLGMGNNPISGVDPDGAWVKGGVFGIIYFIPMLMFMNMILVILLQRLNLLLVGV